jgi:Predicted oxidoreductases (related to aryl-alcohol dehydrogenases)
MRYRALGRTGLVVSEVGFGAWGIGGWSPGELSYGSTEDATSLAALHRAFDLGINFVDTSSLYGLGRSETLIGQAMQGRRDRIVVATKAGYIDYQSPTDYSPQAVARSLDSSLRRLKTDYVDLLQLHGPPLDLLRARPDILGALERLRESGKIRAFGISANSPGDAAAAIGDFGVPMVQVNLSMLDLRALDCGLFDLATRTGAGLIARTPLCFGFLAGTIAENTVFPQEDHRSRWNGPQVARWSRTARYALEAAGATNVRANIQAALRFCLSFPAVSTVIPGILTPEQAVENAEASTLGPLSESTLTRILDIVRRMEGPILSGRGASS